MSAKGKSNREHLHKLLVLYPSLAMGVIGIIYGLAYLQARTTRVHPELAQFEDRTARVARDVEYLVDGALRDLEEISLHAGVATASVLDSDLDSLAADSSHYDRLALVDTSGTLIVGGEDCVPAPEPLHDLLQQALEGLAVFSPPLPGDREDSPVQVYGVMPVLDVLGEPCYVLVGELTMDRFWETLDREPAPSDAVIALADPDGRILLPPAHPLYDALGEISLDGTAATAGRLEPGSAEPYFYVARPAHDPARAGGPGLSVLMMRSLDSMSAPFLRTSSHGTAVAVVVLFLVSLVGYRMNRRVYRPLAHAVQASAKIAKGELDVVVPESGPREIRKIGEAMNHMVAEVKYHRHTLSNMVNTRTECIETARKALEHSMHRLQASYDSAQDAILVIDALNHEILQANRQLAKILDLDDVDLASLTGDDFCRVMREMFADATDFQNRWDYYAGNPEAEGNEEWTLLKPRRMILCVYTSPVRSGDKETIVGRLWTFKDCTEQRELEDKLRQTQKMDAMAHLAGSLAHDFNNLLTVILGNLSIARLEQDEDSEMAGCLASAEDATHEATDLVKQLLGFSDRSQLHLEVVDINRVAGAVSEVLRQTADQRVTIASDLVDGVWDVPADRDQIEQVVMNLGMNAVDAMPDGGTLTFRSQNVVLDTGECDMPPSISGGEFVRLQAIDTGHGMPGHVVERVFEPFFTTRGGEGNQGLGLSMAYGAIAKHGGWITCAPTPNQGTTFSVYLQRTQQKRKPPMTENETKAEMGQHPLVLVVDDEPGVRRIATSVLKRGGFVTAEACDGQEAIDVYQERRAEIGAVLLDLSMPKLSGRETFVALKKIDLNLPILICSGYPVNSDEFADETGYHPDGIVQKPFNVAALCDTVGSILGQSEASTV